WSHPSLRFGCVATPLTVAPPQTQERPMDAIDDIFTAYARTFEAHREAEMSLAEYLEACKKDPLVYSTATERLLAAIGEPQMDDTSKDPRLGRIFMNRTIRVYPAFSEFYGMEETIERIVGFFRHAAPGLEERKQILYPLRPERMGDMLEDRYSTPRRRLTRFMSPWCIKRLDEFGGDITKFRVVRLMP